MAKIIRLTESDLTRIVKRVLNEQYEGKTIQLKERYTKKTSNFRVDTIRKKVESGITTVYLKGSFGDGSETLWIDCDKYNFALMHINCLQRGGVGGQNCKEFENKEVISTLLSRFCSTHARM